MAHQPQPLALLELRQQHLQVAVLALAKEGMELTENINDLVVIFNRENLIPIFVLTSAFSSKVPLQIQLIFNFITSLLRHLS